MAGRLERVLKRHRGLVMALVIAAGIVALMVWGLLTIEPSR